MRLVITNLEYRPTPGLPPILAVPRLEIPDNSVTAIVGPNGAGKTTLLRVLDQHGTDMSGSNAASIRIEPAHEKTVSYRPYHILQEPERNVCGHLTVEENIRLALHRVDETTTATVMKARREWSEILPGLVRNQLVKYLSGGEKQVLGLLLALARSPSLLLLDEHTASLDEPNKRVCAEAVYRLMRAPGRVILWVTQDLALAAERSDFYIVLRGGVVNSGSSPARTNEVGCAGLTAACFPNVAGTIVAPRARPSP